MEDPKFIELSEDINSTGEYVPGVCNIGPAEIQMRRRALYFSLFGAIAAAIFYIITDLDSILGLIGVLILFGIGSGVGISYLQVREKFCVAFGIGGIFNFENLGPRSKVEEKESKAADRAKVRKMFFQGLGIGLVYTLIVISIDLIF